MAVVVVRWASIEEAPTDADALGDAARARLASLRDEGDRRRFVGARLLLRQVVAGATGCPPDEVALHQTCGRCGGPHGRPTVEVGGRAGPEVSFAHAGDLVIVAVGPAPVGVDIEPMRADIAPGDLRTWVRKEAVLKATGHGLDVDPSLLEVGPPTSPPKLTGWHGPGRRPALRMADLEPEPGYLAAVARLGQRPLRFDARAVALTGTG
jgi:4'-phosphopantetheinyl transferase